MKQITAFILLTALMLAFVPTVAIGGEAGVLIAKLKPGLSGELFQSFGLEAEFLFDQTYRLYSDDLSSTISDLRDTEAVQYVHEDEWLRSQINTNDPLYVLDRQELSKQWYLPKIDVHSAWDLSTGSNLITVAVVDTGIDGKHQDLSSGQVVAGHLNYCQVPDPIDSNNCLVRITGSLSAGANSDDNGHGTIVAGIIGATANNSKGIAGINWNVRLMPVKVLNSSGSGSASDVAAGIRWAADNGADIINLSIGGPGLAGLQVLQDAISYAFGKGILIVAAAGNDAAVTGGNLNVNRVSPVCMDGGENFVIGVAALDAFDKKTRFSNYGSDCIDIAAPGAGTFIDKDTKQGIVSTYFDPSRPGEQDLYVYAVGTSLATPIVSGVAALAKAKFPNLDVRALRNRVIAAADDISSQNRDACDGGDCGPHLGSGRINAFKALSAELVFSEGVLVNNGLGETYLVENGLKRPISAFVFEQRFSGSTVTQSEQLVLDRLPTGTWVPPVDGTLVKSPSAPVVYLVEGGERRAMSLPAFASRRFSFSQIVTLSEGEVASYELGSDAAVLDGALLKSANHPAVYILDNGERRLLSFFVFKQRGFDQLLIAEISEAGLAQFPFNSQSNLHPPLDGTLIKGDQSSVVYLIGNGNRRALNFNAFVNRGFRFEDVVVLPQSEVDRYEQSDTIIE